MRDYLIFTIAAPMASFGMKYDPGEWRNSANRPSKSGVLGLIAAALGIEREEQARFDALRDSLSFAVRVDDPGQPAYDYHTSQVPPQKRNRRFATRADELAVPKTELKTILSTREFRVNAFATPALWFRRAAEQPVTLDAIANALRRPHFTLYAGRKSHPLMLPCAPEIVVAENVFAAFDAYHATKPEIARFRKDHLTRERGYSAPSQALVFCETDDPSAASGTRTEQRRDVPESRTKWRFGVRQEAVLPPRGGKP
jgi:CRISPR system Cascade subunit CasD